jgi:hypothetical protein
MTSSKWHALGNTYLLVEAAELTPERVREVLIQSGNRADIFHSFPFFIDKYILARKPKHQPKYGKNRWLYRLRGSIRTHGDVPLDYEGHFEIAGDLNVETNFIYVIHRFFNNDGGVYPGRNHESTRL